MDALLTPELRTLRARARAVAEDVLAPRADATDRDETFPAEQMQALADAGFLAMLVKTDRGGNGHGPVGYALAMTEMARVCASTSVTMAVTNMVADAVDAWGTEEQALLHVPRLASGAYRAGAFALSEPGAGSDAASLRASAVRDGDAYVLNGNKCWITSGDRAGLVLVMAKTDPSGGARGISTFLVRPSDPGFAVGRHEEKMGLRGSTTVTLTLEDVRVPLAARLGAEGAGFRIAMRALDGGRIGIAAQALGIAEGAYEEAVRILGRVPSTLVDGATDLEAARAMVLRASFLKAAGRPFSREASMAKLFSTEAANRLARAAHRAVLESGRAPSPRLDRAVRDVRVTTIYEGTSEIQRLVIARKLFEQAGAAA